MTITTNAALAERLVTEADEASHRRRQLLVASVALAGSTSISAARKVLTGSDNLPPAVISGAVAILDALEESIREPV